MIKAAHFSKLGPPPPPIQCCFKGDTLIVRVCVCGGGGGRGKDFGGGGGGRDGIVKLSEKGQAYHYF